MIWHPEMPSGHLLSALSEISLVKLRKKPPIKEAFRIIWHRAIFPGVNPKYCNRSEA